MSHDTETHSSAQCTVSHVHAHLVAAGLLGIAVTAMLSGHAALWDRPAGTLLDDLFASNALFVAIGVGVIVHEVLHAIGFRYLGGAPWRAIRLGIQWRTLTPFARAIVPVTVRAYQWTAALPGLALGVLPVIAGIMLDAPLASGFGVVMLTGAGGDAAILWATRRAPPLALVLDSDTALGCSIVSPGRPDAAVLTSAGNAARYHLHAESNEDQ